MKYLRYLEAQLKRALKHLIPVLPVAILLFACLGLTAYFLLAGPLRERESRYRIGVVGDMEDPYMVLGYRALRTFDHSRDMVELISMTEEEAEREFRAGRIYAYVTVPEGLADSIIHGRNDTPVRYVFSDGHKGIEGYLMDELSVVVSDLVSGSQAAVFSVQKAAYDYNPDEAHDMINNYSMELIRYLVNRTGLAKLEELGISKGLLVRQYYFCTTLLMFCFMFGISSSSFFFRRNNDLCRWMKVQGIGPLAQVLCEYCAYCLMMTACLFAALAALGAVTEGMAFLHKEIWMGDLFISLLPIVMMVGALHFVICEIIKNPVANIILQFTCTLAMGYVSGYIYPANSFPQSLAGLGRILPTGVALNHISDTVFDAGSGNHAILLTVYTIVFVSISVFCRELESRRDERI